MRFRYDVSRWTEQVGVLEIIRVSNAICKYLTLTINRYSRCKDYAQHRVNQIVEVNHAPMGVHESAGTTAKDRKSTRLNSSHLGISYAVFCLKKKKKNRNHIKHKQQIEINSRRKKITN